MKKILLIGLILAVDIAIVIGCYRAVNGNWFRNASFITIALAVIAVTAILYGSILAIKTISKQKNYL